MKRKKWLERELALVTKRIKQKEIFFIFVDVVVVAVVVVNVVVAVVVVVDVIVVVVAVVDVQQNFFDDKGKAARHSFR